jgi:membrane protease YdiL (CAAX protease family)
MKASPPVRPVIAYFGLAYASSWGLILGFLASKGFRFTDVSLGEGFLIFLCMLAGPSFSGLLLTWRLDGRSGLADVAERARRWQVEPRWLAVALGTNPVVYLTILGTLTILVSPAFAPGFQPIGLVIGLLAGVVEELGWTGFATPRLLCRWSPLRAGLTLGLVWATWHALADFTGNSATIGGQWLPYFFIYWIVTLTAYRVLMTFAYAHTRSLLVAMVMHASYTGWQFALSPGTSGDQTFVWQALLAMAFVAIAAVVAVRERSHALASERLATPPREPALREAVPGRVGQ